MGGDQRIQNSWQEIKELLCWNNWKSDKPTWTKVASLLYRVSPFVLFSLLITLPHLFHLLRYYLLNEGLHERGGDGLPLVSHYGVVDPLPQKRLQKVLTREERERQKR